MKRQPTHTSARHFNRLLCMATLITVCALGAFVWAEQQAENQPNRPAGAPAQDTGQLQQQNPATDLTRYRWDGAAEIAWLDAKADEKSANDTPILGVNVRSADATLRHHLGLPQGIGLVVQHVTPGGAAAKAGIQQHDVLQKFDDQILVNDQQLATLIQMHQPGDQVQLRLIRAGKPMDQTAVLGAGSHPSSIELFPKNLPYQDFTQHFGKIHDMTDPSMLNCKACHAVVDRGAGVSN